MKPPVCAVCGARIPYEGLDEAGQGLVEFKKRPADLQWDLAHKPEHPPYAEWFCVAHYPRAVELSSGPIHIALEILEREFGGNRIH